MADCLRRYKVDQRKLIKTIKENGGEIVMKRRSLSWVLSGSAACVAVTLFAPSVSFAQAASSAAPPKETELIVVTGIRRALEQAVELKRNADQVSDVITAEDVGKLPDANVAEALQRITGVQITRVFGEGQSVSIRGLQQVRVEVDGRTLLGFSARVSPPENDNLGRSSGLDSVPSSLFGKLTVNKSPLASQAEGGLGGTVNLNTPKPFSFRKPTVSIRAQGTYSEGADKTEPGVTALFTTTFADRRIGLLVSAEYQKRSSNLQLFERNNFFNALNGGTTTVLVPRLLQYENTDIDRSRFGVNASMQFQVTPNFLITADALYSEQRADRTNQFLAFNLSTSATAAVVTNPTVDDRGFVVAGSALGNIRTGSQNREDPTTSTLFGLNGKYDDGRWSLEGDVYFSQGTLRQKIEVITLQTPNNAVRGTFDYRGGVNAPSLTLATPTGAVFDPTLVSNYPVGTRTDLLTYRANLLPATMEETTGRFDVGYLVRNGVKVSAGVRYVNLTAVSEAFRSRANGTEAQLTPFYTTGSDAFLNRIGGNFPRRFLTATPDAAFVIERSLIGEPSLEAGAPAGTYRRNAARDYDLTEETLSGYLMLAVETELFDRPAKFNAGVRVSNTDFVVDTFSQAGNNAPLVPRTDVNSYTNVLPTANLVVNVTDNFLVRFSLSETMQRAGLAELAPSTFVDATNRTSSGGNASLKPPTSSNADISFEYYTGKSSLISGAIFTKSVRDFIATTTTEEIIPGFTSLGPIRVTRPSNVDSAEVKGFEIGTQQFFDKLPAPFDGLGVIANYTYSDSSASNGFPLVAVSKHSYNLVGLYEKGRFSARVAYNWRDDAVFEFTQGRPDVILARSQLDAQFSFDLNSKIALSFQAQNLIPEDAATVEVSNFNETAINSYALSETRYTFGIRAKF
jgi:iron complex outermembrane receptor protein